MPEPLKKIPPFKTEAAECKFWEHPENDSTAYVNWDNAKLVRFPNLPPSKK